MPICVFVYSRSTIYEIRANSQKCIRSDTSIRHGYLGYWATDDNDIV